MFGFAFVFPSFVLSTCQFIVLIMFKFCLPRPKSMILHMVVATVHSVFGMWNICNVFKSAPLQSKVLCILIVIVRTIVLI
jgi:uncharacterized membrane protein YqjE